MTSVAIGLSRDLPPKRVMRAQVSGHDLAIWRDADGGLHAWNNRCPHRGMRLSHGFVRGDNLACLYHGWHYGKTGRCSYIPAHPDLDPPATIHVQDHKVSEADGVIWVDTQSGDGAAQSVDSAANTPLRSLSFNCPEDAVYPILSKTPCEGHPADPIGLGQFDIGGHPVVIHLQAISDTETMAHVLTGPDMPLAGRKAVSRWCEAARMAVEAGDV